MRDKLPDLDIDVHDIDVRRTVYVVHFLSLIFE